MRKSLAIVLILAVVSVGGLFGLHFTVRAAEDDLQVTETVVSGDPAAAQGLALTSRYQSGYQLYWETRLLLGGEEKTAFRFKPQRGNETTHTKEYTLDGRSIIGNYDMSGAVETTKDMLQLHFSGAAELVREVYDRTPNGEQRTETLRLRDYMEYAPVKYQMLINNYIYDSNDSSVYTEEEQAGRDALHAIADGFRFPIPDDCEVTITLGHEDEYVTDVKIHTDRPTEVSTMSDGNAKGIFFCVDAWQGMEDGLYERADFSNTPYGYGVYRLPLDKDGKPGKLEMALPLDTEKNVNMLQLDTNGERVLVIVEEKDERVLYVLDSADGKMLQRIPLWEIEDNEEYSFLLQMDKDLIMPFRDDTRFTLLQKGADGSYAIVCNGEMPALQEGESNHWRNYSLAYDGERLAAAFAPSWRSRNGSDIELCVFDADGALQYHGAYHNSLQDTVDADETGSRYWIDLEQENSVLVEWTTES